MNHLPDGWGLRSTSKSCHSYILPYHLKYCKSGTVYAQIHTRLEVADFEHVQGSVYQQDNSFTVAAWAHMLYTIEPLGIIPSSLKVIQMFFIPFPVMITTEDMWLHRKWNEKHLNCFEQWWSDAQWFKCIEFQHISPSSSYKWVISLIDLSLDMFKISLLQLSADSCINRIWFTVLWIVKQDISEARFTCTS